MKKTILTIILLLGTLISGYAQTNNQEVGKKYIYEFRDGTTIIGSYIKDESGNIYINDLDGNEVYLPRVMVAQIHDVTEDNLKDGEYWFPNLHGTRYFFAPTAYGLKEGEGYYHNSYWMFWQAQWGITDELSIGGGTSFFGIPATLNAKYSLPIVENDLYWSAGWFWIGNLFWEGDNRTWVNMPFSVITKGTKENNVTLGIGYNLADHWNDNVSFRTDHKERITLNAGATFRTSRRFSFIAEVWLFTPGDPSVMGGPGIRYFRKINRVTAKNGAGARTFDFQLLMNPEIDGIIPLIGTSQKF